MTTSVRLLAAIGRRVSLSLRPARTQTSAGRVFQTGVVIPVSEELHNVVRRAQVRLLAEVCSHLRLEEAPHVTLKQAFDTVDLARLERYFDGLVAELEPFDLRVRDVGCFDEGTLYLGVAPSRPLDDLRARVLADLARDFGVHPYPIESNGYVFHVTVAQGLPPEIRSRAKQLVAGSSIDSTFACSSLALMLSTGAQCITYKQSTLARSRS